MTVGREQRSPAANSDPDRTMAYPGQQYHSSHHGSNSAYPANNRPQYPAQHHQQQQAASVQGRRAPADRSRATLLC